MDEKPISTNEVQLLCSLSVLTGYFTALADNDLPMSREIVKEWSDGLDDELRTYWSWAEGPQ